MVLVNMSHFPLSEAGVPPGPDLLLICGLLLSKPGNTQPSQRRAPLAKHRRTLTQTRQAATHTDFFFSSIFCPHLHAGIAVSVCACVRHSMRLLHCKHSWIGD